MFTIELLEVKQPFVFSVLTVHNKRVLLRNFINIGKKHFSKDGHLTPSGKSLNSLLTIPFF